MQFNKILPKRRFGNLILWVMFAALFISSCDRRPDSRPHFPVPEVATVTISTESVVLTRELPGRTAAYRVAEIRPQVNGLIQKRLFTEGSDIKADQMLYQIDPAPFQAALDNAHAALARAEANLATTRSRAERFEALLPFKAVSQQDSDDATAALKQAEADITYFQAMVQTARINLGYTRITAPIAGRIGRSNVTEGALVTAHQPATLATIQQLNPIYVDVLQSTTELLQLKRSLNDGILNQNGTGLKKVKLIMEDGSLYPLEGTFQFQDVTVDQTTGSVILRFVFPNPEAALLPGMFVRAMVKEGINEHAILIPQRAVSRDPKGNPMTLIVDAESKVSLRMLTLYRAVNNNWIVTSGLAPGDRVIVEGMQRVRPGASVKAVPFAPQGKKDANPEITTPTDPTPN